MQKISATGAAGKTLVPCHAESCRPGSESAHAIHLDPRRQMDQHGP
jgi:hypothetical protein